ncbi:MAG: antibiotic biosynthesis monooxygenase [Proteobacteria bacterium]|nr:antibiotic biosynthesis monooxygenase [Pseudomonadota bacterium]
MISRLWRGWTIPQNADAYETLLRTQIFPGILARNVKGFRRIELMRRSLDAEVEFVTVMWFDSLDAVKVFAGEAWEVAVVPPAARAVLARLDERSQHYEACAQRTAES